MGNYWITDLLNTVHFDTVRKYYLLSSRTYINKVGKNRSIELVLNTVL